jgi:hypothetical protein
VNGPSPGADLVSASRFRPRAWWHWALVVAGVLALLDLVATLSGGSIDPTDPSNFDHFTLINDGSGPVMVVACESPACGHDGSLRGSGQLAVGGHVEAEVPWGDHNRATYRVRVGTGGRELGCIELDASSRRPAVQVPLSTAQPCP